MSKKQQHIRISERTQQQLATLCTGGATITEVVTVAVDRMYAAETGPEHWWHWAIRSQGGRKAISDAKVTVNFLRPWYGVSDGVGIGGWRAQPFIDPDEPADGHTWEAILSELREELSESAGIFYVEHVNHNPGPGMAHRDSHDSQTLIAVSADGKRSAWRHIYESRSGA